MATKTPPAVPGRPRLIELRATNFMRLKAVTIRPQGALTVIAGDNAQGKSSVLLAAKALCTDRKADPEEVIRRGAAGAVVIGTFRFPDGTGFEAELNWTEVKTELHIRGLNGQKYPSTRKWFDEMTGGPQPIAFDPLAFMRKEPREQRALLFKLLGIDTTEIDARRAAILEKKTRAEERVTSIATRLLDMPEDRTAPTEFALVDELLAEQDRLLAEDRRVTDLERAAEAAAQREAALQRTVTDLEEQLAALQVKLTAARAELDTARTAAEDAEAAAGMAERPDLDAIRQQLADADGHNARVRDARARADVVEELTTWQDTVLELTEALSQIDADKRALLTSAEMPVPGLGFSDVGVTYHDLPLKQASGAEQLGVCVGIGARILPQEGVRLMTIEDGSALDDAHLASLQAACERYELCAIIERVGLVAGDGVVVIEDGVELPQQEVKRRLRAKRDAELEEGSQSEDLA